MALDSKMYDAVNLLVLHKLVERIEITDIHLHELLVGHVLDVLEIGEVDDFRDCRLMFFLTEAVPGSIRFCFQSIKFFIIICHSGRFGRTICPFSMAEAQFPWEALFYVHIFVSGCRQLRSLLYPVRYTLSAVLALEVVL